MVITLCHLKTTNGPKMLPEAISKGLKFKQILWGMPAEPLEGVLSHTVPSPPLFSLGIILPPLSIFLNETLPCFPHNYTLD